jgi:hypothetical protein
MRTAFEKLSILSPYCPGYLGNVLVGLAGDG